MEKSPPKKDGPDFFVKHHWFLGLTSALSLGMASVIWSGHREVRQ